MWRMSNAQALIFVVVAAVMVALLARQPAAALVEGSKTLKSLQTLKKF
jgi:hypothetical protein